MSESKHSTLHFLSPLNSTPPPAFCDALIGSLFFWDYLPLSFAIVIVDICSSLMKLPLLIIFPASCCRHDSGETNHVNKREHTWEGPLNKLGGKVEARWEFTSQYTVRNNLGVAV